MLFIININNKSEDKLRFREHKMADKPTDDPRNSWLSKTFGKNAPNDAPGKAAWTSFRNDFIDVEKKDIHAHGFFAIMPTILLLPLALFSYSHIDQERLQTTYDPLIQETQIEENDALDNNQFQTFIFNDTYYLLSHIDGQYRLFSYKNSAFKFIKDPRDAFLIVRNAGENMAQYAQAVTDPSIELPDTNAELFHLNQGLSQLYNANSPTRHLTGSASTEDQPITTQSYKDAGDALIATSIHIMGGQYGFSEDQDLSSEDLKHTSFSMKMKQQKR